MGKCIGERYIKCVRSHVGDVYWRELVGRCMGISVREDSVWVSQRRGGVLGSGVGKSVGEEY